VGCNYREAEYKSRCFNSCGITLFYMRWEELKDMFGDAGERLYFLIQEVKAKNCEKVTREGVEESI
jgi:hypothetical protein